jgi:hypothetical protein
MLYQGWFGRDVVVGVFFHLLVWLDVDGSGVVEIVDQCKKIKNHKIQLIVFK